MGISGHRSGGGIHRPVLVRWDTRNMPQEDYDWLCIELNQCIAQAQALQLGHAVLLMKMALMEVVDRAAEREARDERRETS
jgi:hypothetical protein